MSEMSRTRLSQKKLYRYEVCSRHSQLMFLYVMKFDNNMFRQIYIGYSESKYRLHISLAHPPDCHFAHVQ